MEAESDLGVNATAAILRRMITKDKQQRPSLEEVALEFKSFLDEEIEEN